MDKILEQIDDLSVDELYELTTAYEFREEYEKAAELLAKASERGDLLATYDLAQYYEQGRGVKQDYVKAAEHYVMVSECREPLVFADPFTPLTPQCDAEYAVGCFYEKELIPNSSMEKAIEWFLRAVDDGSPKACFKMAKWYFDGIGVQQDYDKAASCLSKGSNYMQDEDEECFELALNLLDKTETWQARILQIIGVCYENGIGVEANEEKASEYYEKANQLFFKSRIYFSDNSEDINSDDSNVPR